MKKIFKFKLEGEVVSLPVSGWQFLSAQFQNGPLVFWAAVDPHDEREDWQHVVVMTGGEPPENGVYLGTFQMDPTFVVHHYLVKS